MAGGKADVKVDRAPTMNAKNSPANRPADPKDLKKDVNQIQQGGPPQLMQQQPQQQQQQSLQQQQQHHPQQQQHHPQQQQHHPQQHGGGGGGGGQGMGGMGNMGHFGGGGGGQRKPFNKRGGGGGGFNAGGDHSNYMNRQRGMGGGNQNMSISGPTTNLASKEGEPKKFTGRCRLFVGNLTPDIDETEFRKMFEAFGALSEVFLNAQKGFGFVKMDTRANAEMARTTLDGTQRKGRVLRVRFATHGAALKVRNLSSFVSNELLELAFSLFGEVERAVVVVDDRGKPTGDGIVEYARKPGAQMALKRCTDGAFLMTSSPRPVIVEPLEQKDDEDGYPEKILPKNSQQYLKERDMGPRFAQHGSFEYEFSLKWKQLYELEKQKRESLEKDIAMDRERLDDSMEFALYEHETNILREKLRQREQDANNLMREREMRRHERLREDEERQKLLRQHDEYNMLRNDELRRRQEDTLLMQANHLNSLLDQQEAALRQMQASGVNTAGGGTGSSATNSTGASVSVGRGGSTGALGGGSGGPAGPVMSGGNMAMASGMSAGSMNSAGLSGQNATAGQGLGSGQMPRQSRFDQASVGASAMMGQGPNGPGAANHMSRGMGAMGAQMGGPMGDMRGGGMGRRELMDRRDHRDEYVDAKRRRY